MTERDASEMFMKAARYLLEDGACLEGEEAIEIGLFLAQMGGVALGAEHQVRWSDEVRSAA